MTTIPALQLTEADRDAATELDATEHVPSIALVLESDEDEAEAVTDGSFMLERASTRAPATTQVPDPAALSPRIPSAERLVPDLEMLVLQQDNVRLLRENGDLRQQLEALQADLTASQDALRDLEYRSNDWQDQAEMHGELLREVMRERDHFRKFSLGSLWTRLRGCPPMPSMFPVNDP
ncbi:MAG: hypothetical protein CL927_12225 [Deltaproteobacteria bacterium]|nr:hypothetical protein [Deltaproteobacteria bacterium]HCH65407.1 hypothetical protein [Deltaproteobacteria bacterium]